jgi:hypothetical protein
MVEGTTYRRVKFVIALPDCSMCSLIVVILVFSLESGILGTCQRQLMYACQRAKDLSKKEPKSVGEIFWSV